MSEPGDGAAERGSEPATAEASAPWERPRRWGQRRLEPTQVDDLLVRLGPADGIERRRKHRADSSEASLAASDLIAALSGPDDDTAVAPGAALAQNAPAGTTAAGAASIQSTARPIAPSPAQAPIPPPPITPPRRRPGWLVAGRVAAALLAVLLVLSMGLEWQIKQRAEQGLRENHVSALDTTDSNIVAPTVPPTGRTAAPGSAADTAGAAAPPIKTYPVENILLLGSDTRADGNGNATNSNGDQTSAQSDTLMVAHLSADRQHVTILSIPRDTMIPAPTCKQWDYTTGKVSTEDVPISVGQRFHINNAYAVGGPACTVTAIQALTGLKIDRLIGIDFNGFKAMVDALGGITVNVCRPIVDREINTVIPTAGVQVIHGEQALNLVRARNVIGDTQSDLARIRRQQVVLSSILRQVTSAGTLLNPSKLDNFLQAFTKNTFTENVSVNDLVDLAGSLGDLSPGKVTFYTLPTLPSQITEGALEVDETKAPAVFDALINDYPLPGETTTSTSPPTTASTGTTRPTSSSTSSRASSAPSPQQQLITVAPLGVDVQIYNVTGQAGIGAEVQASLTGVGFQISDDDVVRPANQTQQKVTVEYSDGNRAAALTLAAAVPGSRLVLTPGLGQAVRLMVGSDYDGQVTDVSVGAQLPASLRETTSSPTSAGSTTTTRSTSTSRTIGTLRAGDLPAVNAGAALCA